MEKFWKLYAWAMDIKLDMALYSLGILIFKGFYDFILGKTSVDMLHIVEIVLLGFILSLLQHGFFPKNKELSSKDLSVRTVWWVIAANAIVMPLAIMFKLFSGGELWTVPVLICVFELVLAAMWFGIHVALKYDTHCLNNNLKAFQNK